MPSLSLLAEGCFLETTAATNALMMVKNLLTAMEGDLLKAIWHNGIPVGPSTWLLFSVEVSLSDMMDSFRYDPVERKTRWLEIDPWSCEHVGYGTNWQEGFQGRAPPMMGKALMLRPLEIEFLAGFVDGAIFR